MRGQRLDATLSSQKSDIACGLISENALIPPSATAEAGEHFGTNQLACWREPDRAKVQLVDGFGELIVSRHLMIAER
jgi:hypothetical protein